MKKFIIAALPFFFLGYIIVLVKDKFVNFENNKKILIILTIFVFTVIEYTVTRTTGIDLYVAIYLILLILILMLINFPMPRFTRTSSTCRVLANFTYYSHGLFMSLINLILEDVFKLYISGDLWFITTLIITGMCGFIIYKINNRYLNKLVS